MIWQDGEKLSLLILCPARACKHIFAIFDTVMSFFHWFTDLLSFSAYSLGDNTWHQVLLFLLLLGLSMSVMSCRLRRDNTIVLG